MFHVKIIALSCKKDSALDLFTGDHREQITSCNSYQPRNPMISCFSGKEEWRLFLDSVQARRNKWELVINCIFSSYCLISIGKCILYFQNTVKYHPLQSSFFHNAMNKPQKVFSAGIFSSSSYISGRSVRFLQIVSFGSSALENWLRSRDTLSWCYVLKSFCSASKFQISCLVELRGWLQKVPKVEFKNRKYLMM